MCSNAGGGVSSSFIILNMPGINTGLILDTTTYDIQQDIQHMILYIVYTTMRLVLKVHT